MQYSNQFQHMKDIGNMPTYNCSQCGKEVSQLYSTKWASDVCIDCNNKVAQKAKEVMERLQATHKI